MNHPETPKAIQTLIKDIESQETEGDITWRTNMGMIAILDKLIKYIRSLEAQNTSLREALESIAHQSTSMAPAMNDEVSHYRNIAFSNIGTAARCLASL
jgi:hypothetical protein